MSRKYLTFTMACLGVGVSSSILAPHDVLCGEQSDWHDAPAYDVAIIGGGSSGTYTAIQLQKAGKSVIVIERQDKLGGHVDTYIDPVTNGTMDYGAINYINTSTARDYFDYLGVPTRPFQGFTQHPETDNVTALWADFARAIPYPQGGTLKSQNETIDVADYTLFEQQPEYIHWTGGTGYRYLPDPVPEELFQPFGVWLQQHNFSAIAYQEWYQGAGNVLQQMTLYMLKYIDQDYHNGRLIIGDHYNQFLYDTALAKMTEAGSRNMVYLNSEPTRITRQDSGHVQVTFQDGQANFHSIQARQLVLAIPPLYENLKPFLDMHHTEASLFSKFINITYWAAIAEDTGLGDYTGISNIVINGEANVPQGPGNLGLSPSSIKGRDLHATWWVDQKALSELEVIKMLVESSSNATRAWGISPPEGKQLSIAALDTHTPYLMTVSEEDIKDGFYKKLLALQGQRNTWYTGSAWESEDSAAIWNYTLYQVMPGILAALGEGNEKHFT